MHCLKFSILLLSFMILLQEKRSYKLSITFNKNIGIVNYLIIDSLKYSSALKTHLIFTEY